MYLILSYLSCRCVFSNLIQSFDFFLVFLQLDHRLALQCVVLEPMFLLDVRQLLVLHAQPVHHLHLVAALFRLKLQMMTLQVARVINAYPKFPMSKSAAYPRF